MPRKGRIEVGADADLALVDLGAEYELTADDLQYRHQLSPWIGRRLRARVTRDAAARRRGLAGAARRAAAADPPL